MSGADSDDVQTEWVHIAYEERSRFSESYGFSGSQGVINLEGMRLRPRNGHSSTLMVYMHPSSTLHLLPAPQAMARAGAHVLCAASRYVKNDATLIFEKVILDLGAYIRHAKEVWGYRKIVLVGWSGGGSLALMYQSHAERPSIMKTPAGDTVDLLAAELTPADAVIFQSAHLSRAHLITDNIDPSVIDEARPEIRDVGLDIYDPANPSQPPYSSEYVSRYRTAQLARVHRISAWVRQTLADVNNERSAEVERAFVVHRTMADLRYMDPALDPNERKPRWSYMGDPAIANSGPVGLARFSSLRSWLSQWSIEDSQADAVKCAARSSAPLLVIEHGADDGVPQPHPGMVYRASCAKDKSMHVIRGANHYCSGQPEHISMATELIRDWLRARQLLGH